MKKPYTFQVWTSSRYQKLQNPHAFISIPHSFGHPVQVLPLNQHSLPPTPPPAAPVWQCMAMWGKLPLCPSDLIGNISPWSLYPTIAKMVVIISIIDAHKQKCKIVKFWFKLLGARKVKIIKLMQLWLQNFHITFTATSKIYFRVFMFM